MALGVAVFAVGALCVAVGSSWRTEALAPGELAQPHARLIAGSQNRCSACHPGGVEAALGLPADDAHRGALAQTQSALCMECHQEQFQKTHALSPHGLPAGTLGGEHQNQTQHESIACATCHQEHHGADHDLTFITNGRCQACHQEQFDSFAGDHPNFGHWPYRRRTRINFDHNAHATKHFATKGEAFDCQTCHIDGPHGEAKLTLGFEQSCAQCHESDIGVSAATGIRVLALPTLDEQAIATAGAQLGAWPEGAVGDFDGELPAITKLLLAADPQANAALARLGYDFSFFDLDPDAPADARDAAALAEAMRKLLGNLAERGHAEIFQRVAKLTGAPELDARKSLAGAAPVALFGQAGQQWFAATARGRPTATPTATPDATDLANRQSSGGWLLDNNAYSLRYVPTGHTDPLLQAWIELAASLGDDHAQLRSATLAQLAGAKSAGRCATCHSIEQSTNGRLIVNWKSRDTSDVPRTFTKFSHRPHITQPELANCTHCHALDPTADRQSAPYATLQPRDFVSQFQPITKTSCIECHQPKAAGDSCTQCHNYHVDTPRFRTSSATLGGRR